MLPLLRRAQRGDVGTMQRIRASVKENRLTSRALSEADYLQAIERDGRGWVMDVDGQVLGFAIANGQPTYVNTMHRDRSGIVWVGAVEGLRQIVGDEVRAIPIPREYGVTSVTCLSSDSRGGLWLGNGVDVLHWDRRRFTRLQLPRDAPSRGVVCVHNDARDRLWIGFRDAKLSLRETNGTYRHFGPETFGTEANTIYSVAESRDGTIWVATNAGVTRVTERNTFTFRRSHGLPSDRVWSVVEDNGTFLWLSLDVGIVRVDPAEFERTVSDAAHRLQYESFDAADGLAGAPILRVRSGRAVDGTVWFVRGGALTVADTDVLTNWPKPGDGAVRIERVMSDDQTFDPARSLAVRSRMKRLEIDYTAIALTQPGRVRFRYRLEGFDSDWIQADSRRTAVYTNLPPRDYRFVVEAGSERAGWRGSPAVWQFSVAPAFYQSAWFYTLCILAAGVIVWATWRFRVGLVRREYAAVLAERTRMSREIHDTLLQGVVGVALDLDEIAHAVGAVSAEAREALVRTRREVEAYVREARQSILALRSPLLETRALPDVLREFGNDATARTPVTFTLTVTGRVRRCSPRLENELLRIGQEAITNAMRHAHARSIRVELKFTSDSVALTVVDDGCGITYEREEQATGEVHYGLIVMKERAENLGGRVSIAPLPEGGTKIEAVLPAPAAA